MSGCNSVTLRRHYINYYFWDSTADVTSTHRRSQTTFVHCSRPRLPNAKGLYHAPSLTRVNSGRATRSLRSIRTKCCTQWVARTGPFDYRGGGVAAEIRDVMSAASSLFWNYECDLHCDYQHFTVILHVRSSFVPSAFRSLFFGCGCFYRLMSCVLIV